LLHGLGAGASTWVEVVERLRSGFRVAAFDLPGHGGSTAPSRTGGIASYADVVAGAIRALGLTPAVLVGHSFGGQVALAVAARHPGVVRALVLVGPSGIARLPARTRVLAVLTTTLRPGARIAPLGLRLAGRAWFRRLALGRLPASHPAALPARAVRGFFSELREHTDVRTARRALLADPPFARERAPACPAIVLWGVADAVVPVEHGFALARTGNVRLRTVADCGHLLIGERPEAVVDAIAAVLTPDQTGFSTSMNSHSTSS